VAIAKNLFAFHIVHGARAGLWIAAASQTLHSVAWRHLMRESISRRGVLQRNGVHVG